MKRLFLPIAVCMISAGTIGSANPCIGGPYVPSAAPHLAPGSVPSDQLAEHLHSWDYSHGIQFDISLVGEQLRVDIIDFPGETRLVAGLFAILQISRLVEEDFGMLVLMDEGRGRFAFRGSEARTQGCRTLWGVDTTGTAIPMFIDIMRNVVDSDSQRITPAYTGYFLADINRALDTFNQVIAPEWIYSSVR